jgi:site-specific recombinase XerC
MTPIAPTLQAFFTDRLARQLDASPRTIASYRDTLRLLLCFAQETTGRPPSALDWADLDEALIAAFLTHLEVERGNGARTRNLRLTAIRSLFRYAALRHPEHAAVIARVLAIPPKRFERRAITFLSADEAGALVEAPDPGRWEGRRDRALLVLASRQGFGSPSSSRSAARTSCSGPARTCAARARAESSARCRSPRRRRRCSACDSKSGPAGRRTRSFRPAPAGG